MNLHPFKIGTIITAAAILIGSGTGAGTTIGCITIIMVGDWLTE